MRSLLLLAFVAACASTPAMPNAPEPSFQSKLEPGGTLISVRRCLYVVNHTGQSAALFVGAEHVGWIGAKSSAAFYVGSSAGVTSRLKAICGSGQWSATVKGPPWGRTWHLR
ncbi:MAG: hypothetical protein ACYSX0_03745 [Planctomycetota bacterium]